MICNRPAPNALRVANSRFLAVARTSNRLATFAQAINNTKLTAPSKTSNESRASPTILSCNDGGCAAFVAGFAWGREFCVESEEHTSELQSRPHLVCRLLL